MKFKFISFIVALSLITTVLSACSNGSKPAASDEKEGQTSNESVDKSNTSEDFKIYEILFHNFAVPEGYTLGETAIGSCISIPDNPEAIIIISGSDYDLADSYDQVVEVSKERIMHGVYSKLHFLAEDIIVSSSELQTNKYGKEMLKVNGYFVSSDDRLEFITYYSIVDGPDGKYPIYWVGVPFQTDDMTEIERVSKIIAENFD